MTASVASRGDVAPKLAASSLLVGAAALAAFAPVRLSMASVFLFAGPHNWMEARYCLARMPVRWGRLRPFFLTAIGGVILLSLTFTAIPMDRSLWHTALAAWALSLVHFTRRNFSGWALPVLLLWTSLAWRDSSLADLLLVYLHPLAALWFLKRQIARSYPEWTPLYRVALAAVPFLALWIFAVAPAVHDQWLLRQSASSSSLVAVHAFLELLHYGVWALLLPAIGLAGAPWRLSSIPLVRHRLGFPRLARGVLIGGAALVVVLWIAFTRDFEATRQIYFTIAVAHVLAEAPFLLWLR
jgi:hypothetical protein